MSTITAIADAVAASLNAGSYSMPITAQRAYQPSFTLEDLQDLHVSVVPRSVTIAAASRAQSQYDFAIDVGIQKKLASGGDEAEIDRLLDLTEEIADRLRFARLDDFPGAAWVGIAHEPVLAAEHLDQHRQFTSILTIKYRVRR